MKRRLLSAACFLGVCAVAAGGYRLLTLTHHSSEHPGNQATVPVRPARHHVKLTGRKRDAAGIQIATVAKQTLQPRRNVSGRIEYNSTRHIAVKSPADGLVRRVTVTVGEQAKEGQLLAIINSPELGERRADVLKQQAELELARRERDWWRSIKTNLDDLLQRLKRPQEIAKLEADFDDKTLGDFRRGVFTAYSRYQTAESISANLKGVTGGAISQRTILEQASARDEAAATFRSTCEQATFDARQKVSKAEADFDDATRRLAVARQRLTFLTGQSDDQVDDLNAESDLTTWPVKAPFDATIEDVYPAAAERVRQGEDILLIADTSRLWVQADIRDHDWTALTLTKGQQIQVQSPALPGRTLDATIAFIGRTVNAETRAAPLVADINNEDLLLKPGMFVRVLLPDGPPIQVLAVPESAIVRHEGRVFVFVVEGNDKFVPRDVAIGPTIDSWVEIHSGLTEGDRIAVAGTFVLKSELLLEAVE